MVDASRPDALTLASLSLSSAAEREKFLLAMLEALVEQVAVVDQNGTIVYVNPAWIRFGEDNGIPTQTIWPGVNYLEICRAAKGDRIAQRVAQSVERVLLGQSGNSATVEYPCHSPTAQRWFLMRVTRMTTHLGRFAVVVHENITRRKLAELRAAALAVQDPLTGLANRRAFNHAFSRAWLRCRRAGLPVSLLSLDLDHFKQLNDTYGHPAGDACLKWVARTIRRYARRSEDIAARVGGEEFALLLPETSLEVARQIAEQLRRAIARHDEKRGVPVASITASIGVVGAIPTREMKPDMLIAAADVALYAAKRNGRNQVMLGES